MKYVSSMWSNMINNSKQMNKYRFKNFNVEKRKTQNILPIPYAFLCIVLESLKFSRKSKKNDTTHFMLASYFVLGGNDWGRILKTELKFFYSLL